MTTRGRYTPNKTKHDYIDLNPDPHPPVDCKEGRIKYDAIKQAVEICNNLFVNGSILSPWTLDGDGAWTGNTAEWDMSDGFKRMVVNKDDFGLSYVDPDGNNLWVLTPHTGVNDMHIGNSTTNPDFNVQGSGTATFDGDVDILGELETQGGRIVNTTNIDNTDSPYPVSSKDHEIFVDTDTAAVALNLPAGLDGTKYRIINCGSSGNDVTVTPDRGELLTGATSSETISDGEVMIITYNATQGWW